jgi:hypothetical protein
MRHRAAVLVALLWFGAARTQAAPPTPPDGVSELLGRLEVALRSGSTSAYLALLSTLADRAEAARFAAASMQPGTTRVTLRERDRAPLVGTLPGDGYTLAVDVLIEAGLQARLATWRLDVKRRSSSARDGGEEGGWGIVSQQAVGVLPPLHRLALSPQKQYTGRNVVVRAVDLAVTMEDANVFVGEAGGADTAAVILGRGEMRFAPVDRAERGQIRLFAGAEAMGTPVDAVFVRAGPGELASHVTGLLVERPVDGREWKRADEFFRQEAARSFSLDLGDLSAETFHLLPSAGDFLAEIRTRRFGTLTYARCARDAEDVSLFDRARHLNIAVYASDQQRGGRGRFYSEDDDAEFRVGSYDIDADFEPAQRHLAGRTHVEVTVRASSIDTLTLRLADTLAVRSVVSREYGRLLAVRVRGQQSVVVSLPVQVRRGLSFGLDIAYDGVVTPQAFDGEAMGQDRGEEAPEVRYEASYLYSNTSYWYPQAPSSDYATATIRVRVPPGYSCVASGEPTGEAPAGADGGRPGRRFTFIASQPARYFACLITPLSPEVVKAVPIAEVRDGEAVSPAGLPSGHLALAVRTNPRLQALGRPLAETARDILQFYGSLMGGAPYRSATVAAVEWSLPGGHSPAYMAVIHQPLPGTDLPSYWNDPAFFDGYPEFFVAHELAHQWWGQAVGWKNYHEQWLSEGLAQYFAALYAGKLRGPEAFDAIIRRFRQCAMAMDRSDQGPIYLGYRVGHLKGDSRVFRAIVYNKSAAVLHMMRRLVGDRAFFGGLRRFYRTWCFQKAGSDDLRQAMEAESGRDLGRFFERWIYDDRLPALSVTSRVEDTPRGPEAVVRFEQSGEIFDVPVLVTLGYVDRAADEIVVAVTERVVERRIPVRGVVKKIEVNRDGAALGTISF